MLIRVRAVAICAALLIAGAGRAFSQAPVSSAANADRPRQSLGLDDDRTTQSMMESARAYEMSGDFSAALPLAQGALRNVRKLLDNYGSTQAEHSQLKFQQSVRPVLDTYISAAVGAHADSTEIYSAVLAWKGDTTACQRWTHAARDILKNNPEAVKLYSELDSKSRALSSAYNAIVPSEGRELHKQVIAKLSDDLDNLQLKLAQISQSFRAAREATRCTPADLQKMLPADAALVDLLETLVIAPAAGAEPHFAARKRMLAFVVRRDHPVELVDLGPSDRIRVAVVLWRIANLQKELKLEEHADAERMKKDWDATLGKSAMPEQKLRQWVWDPLAKRLEGCSTVLVAPDGALCYFPWGAFPGEQPGSYLLEERALAVVPVPQLLPEVLAQPARAAGADLVPSMLLVGNVNVNGDPGAPNELPQTAAARKLHQEQALGYMPGTTDDIEAIRELFLRAMPKGFVTKLSGDQPTEQAFRQLAPRSTYIHLAVHGYYESDRVSGRRYRQSLDQHPTSFANEEDVSQAHPDLLCGLVFVGANAIATADKDDGIMTGLELAALDLDRTELISLTSCQSALGTGVAGEGVLGIQRALQVAGAHSTIATLWSVGIDPTDQLMIDFYKNLWEKKLSRVEALRQAQLKMLREGGARFLKDSKSSDKTSKRLLPFFWAAFVLSGDWR